MKIMGKRAGVLAGVYFFSQCLFAYQPENGFWAERRRASKRGASPLLASLPMGGQVGTNPLAAQFPSAQSVGASLSQNVSRSVPKRFLKDHAALFAALAPAHGTVRKVFLPKHLLPRSPVVVHIQDVHMNQEAQWNIRETVRALSQSGQVDLLGLEGATGPIDLQPFVDFPHRRAVEVTANYLLKQNKITGPVHAAFTATGTLPKILGIDDPLHYAANVRAYTDSAVRLDRTRQDLRVARGAIDGRKRNVFSQQLLEFDEQVRSYREGKVSLGDHVLNLTARAPDNVALSLRSFLDALVLERTLDFKQVELERVTLITALAQRLNERETNDLLAQSLAYRSGQLRYGEFYRGLLDICQSKGLPLSRFPAMEAYVRYVLTVDGIDGDRLLEDIAVLEKRAYDRRAKSKEEKALVAESRRAWLTEQLVDFALTPADWKEYQATGTVGTNKELVSFEAFYLEAHARDGAMSENLLRAMGTDGPAPSRTAILVTGGFHAEGMTQRLVEQGVVVVSYVPKIEKIDTAQGSAYLSVFTQEKTPLEKLFAGHKLFLGYNPTAGVQTAVILAPAVAAVERKSVGGISDEAMAKINGYMKNKLPDAVLTVSDPEHTATGGWVAGVGVQVGEERENFSLVTSRNFDIEFFGVINHEERPPTAWLMEAAIWLHGKCGPHAEKVSAWTEAVLFSSLSSWTPANFLWFARRHKLKDEQDLMSLLTWMAITSIRVGRHQNKGISFFTFLEELGGHFKDHKEWNQLGLFRLAANKIQNTKGRNPRFIGKLGFKELKLVDNPEDALNGLREVDGRVFVLRNKQYLILEKKEKRTNKIRWDIPGGGAAGAAVGVSLEEGTSRELWEEIKVFVKKLIAIIFPQQQNHPIYSILGSNADFRARRAITFWRSEQKKKINVVLSHEHTGSSFKSLPDILNNFQKLNTGPRMGFYLEFLREAYGITGVKSLIPLNDEYRLKRLTDPVLIETEENWYLFCPENDVTSTQRMGQLYPHLTAGSVVERRSDKESLLSDWETPAVPSSPDAGKLVMRKVEEQWYANIPGGFGDALLTTVSNLPGLPANQIGPFSHLDDLKGVIHKAYGLDVVSVKPLRTSPGDAAVGLLLKTRTGKKNKGTVFVLREADIMIDRPNACIPLKNKRMARTVIIFLAGERILFW
ncbi:MAG: hypothetical protein IPN19_09015 [Elusimicrobia bacterium]|nr:hypothetical protein [Elusimicrobiota bacterium]